MPRSTNHQEGGCLCGALRFLVTAPALDAGYCHCRMCQKNSGAPVVAWATFPSTNFAWTEGKPDSYASSSHAKRQFCGKCGSYLVFLNTISPNEVSVNTASFDHPEKFPPRRHIYAGSRIGWFKTEDALPSHADSGPPS